MRVLSSLTRMFFVFKGYRGRLLVSQILLMISALASVGVATLTQRLINDGLVAGDMNVIVSTGVWMVVLAIVAGGTLAGTAAFAVSAQDISKLTQNSLREQIGVVLQEAFLFSDTVMNNLRYAREGATDEECIEAAREANAHEFIERLPQGYDTMLTERGSNLSQGQRQMITIARAMVAQPKILVLDEATSNVDTRTEKLIGQGLNKLMEGKTSFVIAHRLSTIRDSHKILVLNGGVIVEQGPHDELMAQQGFYYNLFMSQFKGKGPAGEVDTSGFVST